MGEQVSAEQRSQHQCFGGHTRRAPIGCRVSSEETYWLFGFPFGPRADIVEDGSLR
jgi:hypothetical protein